jgi:poly(hydroxyalkanoate) depolymerase family esterase
MFSRFRPGSPALLSAASVLFATSPSLAASWQSNVDYGGGTTPMSLYVPDAPQDSPPVVVSLHFCSGNAGNAQPWFEDFADIYGFAIITPQAGGNCFDAAPARSGERANIVAMVEYVLAQHGGDPSRVFAAGASSGACMTQALLAAYPEVFAAGSALAGVPAGAWTSGNDYGWSTPAGTNWGDRVREVNPDFSGPWPRFQLWHGQGDTTLTYSQNFPAQVAQWTDVHGVSEATNENIQPVGAQDAWNRDSYLDVAGVLVVETNSGPSNVPHDLTGRGLWADVVRFFALDMPANPGAGSGGVTAGGAAGARPVAGSGGAGTVSHGGAPGAGMQPNGAGGAVMGMAGAGPVPMPTASAPLDTPNVTPAPVVGMSEDPVVTAPTPAPGTLPGAGGTPAMAAGAAGNGNGTSPPPGKTATTAVPSATATTGHGGGSPSSGIEEDTSGDDGGCNLGAGGPRHSLDAPTLAALGLLIGARRRRRGRPTMVEAPRQPKRYSSNS